MPDACIKRRIAHALVSTVVVRGANGGSTVGLARLADVYGGWAVATLWNPPDQRNIVQIMKWGSLGLSLKAGSNVFHEFWPDVKRLNAKRRANKLKQITPSSSDPGRSSKSG